MKTAISMTALGLLFALVVSAPVSAQPAQGQGRDQGPWRVPIASIPVDLLAGPLKLTEDQKTKIKASQDKVVKVRAEAWKTPGAAGGDRAAQAVRDAQETANREIAAVLTMEQKEKAEGIVRELVAYQQLGIPLQVLGDLKLTDAQKAKIKPLAEEARTKVRELRTAGQPDRQARQQVRQEYSAKVFAILTAEQKATIEKWRTANPVSLPGGNPPK